MNQHSISQSQADTPMQLIPVADRNIGGEGVRTVNARDLHVFLENGDNFATWMKERIEQYSFVEGKDFVIYLANAKKIGRGRPAIEYALSLDMAKELSMLERNEKGRQARQYFLDCERRAKLAAVTPALDLRDPRALLQLLTQTTETAAGLQAVIEEQAPKARFYDAVGDAGEAQSIREVAKTFGTGEKRFFAFLRESGVLIENNVPYQRYIDAGHFIVRQGTWTDPTGKPHTFLRTLVTGRGVTYLQKRWADRK